MPPRLNTCARTSDTCDSRRAMGTPVCSLYCPYAPGVDLEKSIKTVRRLCAGHDRLLCPADKLEQVVAPRWVELGSEIVEEEHRWFGMPLFEQLELGDTQCKGYRAGLAKIGVGLRGVTGKLQGEVAAVWPRHGRSPGPLLLPIGVEGVQ